MNDHVLRAPPQLLVMPRFHHGRRFLAGYLYYHKKVNFFSTSMRRIGPSKLIKKSRKKQSRKHLKARERFRERTSILIIDGRSEASGSDRTLGSGGLGADRGVRDATPGRGDLTLGTQRRPVVVVGGH